MKQFLTILVFLVTGNSLKAQTINASLKRELDSLLREDQRWREFLASENFQDKQDSLSKAFNVPGSNVLNHIIQIMNKTDSLNLLRIDRIIEKYGYPGLSLVGKETNEAAFYIIQHSQKIDTYLSAIKKAAKSKELEFTKYAMMLDRSLMYKNKPQIYGTQIKGLQVIDAATGRTKFVNFVWPIEYPEKVNKRRKKAGFNTTVEENAKKLNVDYKILTLDDVRKMQQ